MKGEITRVEKREFNKVDVVCLGKGRELRVEAGKDINLREVNCAAALCKVSSAPRVQQSPSGERRQAAGLQRWTRAGAAQNS